MDMNFRCVCFDFFRRKAIMKVHHVILIIVIVVLVFVIWHNREKWKNKFKVDGSGMGTSGRGGGISAFLVHTLNNGYFIKIGYLNMKQFETHGKMAECLYQDGKLESSINMGEYAKSNPIPKTITADTMSTSGIKLPKNFQQYNNRKKRYNFRDRGDDIFIETVVPGTVDLLCKVDNYPLTVVGKNITTPTSIAIDTFGRTGNPTDIVYTTIYTYEKDIAKKFTIIEGILHAYLHYKIGGVTVCCGWSNISKTKPKYVNSIQYTATDYTIDQNDQTIYSNEFTYVGHDESIAIIYLNYITNILTGIQDGSIDINQLVGNQINTLQITTHIRSRPLQNNTIIDLLSNGLNYLINTLGL